jgi:hypothetical protein
MDPFPILVKFLKDDKYSGYTLNILQRFVNSKENVEKFIYSPKSMSSLVSLLKSRDEKVLNSILGIFYGLSGNEKANEFLRTNINFLETLKTLATDPTVSNDISNKIDRISKRMKSFEKVEPNNVNSIIHRHFWPTLGIQAFFLMYTLLHSRIRSQRNGADLDQLKKIAMATGLLNLAFIIPEHFDLLSKSSTAKSVFNTSHLYRMTFPDTYWKRKLYFLDEKTTKVITFAMMSGSLALFLYTWKQIRYVWPLVPLHLFMLPYIMFEFIEKEGK